MKAKLLVSRHHRLAAFLLGITLTGAVSACGGSTPVVSAPGVSCTNYAIHASGRYQDEVSVRVEVSNTMSRPAHFAVDVELSTSHTPGQAPLQVTIDGLIASRSSAELARKILTTDPVQKCRIAKLSRS